jgi:hypothetical protein
MNKIIQIKKILLKQFKAKNSFNSDAFLPMKYTQNLDRDSVAKAYARVFSTDDGQLILAHLQAQTFLKGLSPDVAESHLRFLEGQRALVHSILRFVALGK